MKPFLKKIKVSQAGWHTPFIPILEGAEADQSRLHIKALTDKTENCCLCVFEGGTASVHKGVVEDQPISHPPCVCGVFCASKVTFPYPSQALILAS